MDIKIIPAKLSGIINAPSSKSFSHRMIIAASLADGVSKIENITPSLDISATVSAMSALGARIITDGSVYTITGIGNNSPKNAYIECCESGSTLRFVMPIAVALNCNAEFNGKGKLPSRPITPYIREMSSHGIVFNYHNDMPFSMSGKLSGGIYNIEGNISSQFVSGLLFALPLCENDSEIRLTSELQSKSYVDMTLSSLKSFGVEITETYKDGIPTYYIKGMQKYIASDHSVEGDYSQAAFFFVANALGSEVNVHNLNKSSIQGDKKILEILNNIGYNDMTKSVMNCFTIDVSDIPDLVPALAVLGSFTSGKCRLVNAQRLKIKESNRLVATANALNAIGGNVKVLDDSLEINPIKQFTGGVADSYNDHRIAMAIAVAATMSKEPVIIKDADSINKSYPAFFEEYSKLGGIVRQL